MTVENDSDTFVAVLLVLWQAALYKREKFLLFNLNFLSLFHNCHSYLSKEGKNIKLGEKGELSITIDTVQETLMFNEPPLQGLLSFPKILITLKEVLLLL